MLYDGLGQELKEEIKEALENAENKSEAIYDAIATVVERNNSKIIERTISEQRRASADENYRKELGLRILSKEEEKFYESLKDVKQALTAKQIDIIPTTIIDRTLESVKQKTDILDLINIAPAGVKKWITGSATGKATWGNLDSEITAELSTTITAINLDAFKLSVFLCIPKSIRELEYPFIDRYFSAILEEAMHDGLVSGYLTGDGKTGPIGIFNQITQFTSTGTAAPKTVLTDITTFSPKGLAKARKTLSNDGKRKVTELHLICNPLDEAEYVDPCLYGEALTGGYKTTSFMPIIKHADPNCPQGKAAFTLKGVYTMGVTGVRFDEYNQTKAIEDCDLIIGKCESNGKADDDNCAIVFNPQKLKEYVLPVNQVTQPVTAAKTEK